MEQTGKTELEAFEDWLYEREKSCSTIDKYLRDVRRFLEFIGQKEWGKRQVLLYKEQLQKHYRVASVNSMLIAINSYLRYVGRGDCCVRTCRVQRQLFREEERDLTRGEYERLVGQAEHEQRRRLSCILQTLGATGIRISELQHITVAALREKRAVISCKGKRRVILLPGSLVNLLKRYCRQMRITAGPVFITRSGRPVDRRNVWAEMKALCRRAGVAASKVFPHNLRHLFARCYYARRKDLARLADYLGHSSVETTRRYTMTGNMGDCLRELELGMLARTGETVYTT